MNPPIHVAVLWCKTHSVIIISYTVEGGADGRVFKVVDSQPRDRGFESRHTLGLLCLKSLGKICTLNVP